MGRTASMYEQWTIPNEWQGHPVIFVAFNEQALNAPEIANYADNLRQTEKISIGLNNNKLRELNYRIAGKYRAK